MQLTADNNNTTVNLTVAEEVPIPVFSEWAQKQMEAAEKQEALQQEVVNNSPQKRNLTNGNGKSMPQLKIRSKNYASPDCGAKIIASNSDASHTGAVLSSSKDEYMLSPCGNRIWFVVELCEAIQARRIELANFELFSSSPKNFSVAVSNRFPTREWSNVGRYVAEDKRTVQSFDLHPHLFGKFVRVDIHSHYSKEHFCPVSLFRVFGTSEFEAFETENHPDEMDDIDEEFVLDQAHAKAQEQNLFKSASDAVISIVKKAAEVLVKPVCSENQSMSNMSAGLYCPAPALEQISCTDCDFQLVESIKNTILIKWPILKSLLKESRVRQDLRSSMACQKFGINFSAGESFRSHSYYATMLPVEYVGALCQMLGGEQLQLQYNNQSMYKADKEEEEEEELPMNLTLGKKRENADFRLADNNGGLQEHTKPLSADRATIISVESSTKAVETTSTTTTEVLPKSNEATNSMELESQIVPPPLKESVVLEDTQTVANSVDDAAEAPDVNIYNVPDASNLQSQENVMTEVHTNSMENLSTEETLHSTTPTSAEMSSALKTDDDSASWDNIDNLLTATATTFPTDVVAPLQKVASSPQSESVFIRLSNRIKALERNMSLSGQYLEELSRRYKKQVEELQQALLQQTKIVRLLEEQSVLHQNMNEMNVARGEALQKDLNELSMQFHACLVVIVCASFFIFSLIISGLLLYRSLRRKTSELLAKYNSSTTTKANNNNNNKKSTHRRKSYDDASDHQKSSAKGVKKSDKVRRPSEEAMIIVKEADTHHAAELNVRRRKVSICYGSGGNLNVTTTNKTKANRRKAHKISLPARLQPWQRLEETEILEPAAMSAASSRVNVSAPAKLAMKEEQALAYDESANLEDDDLDNFLPNADLAYNEFMPEGPSGYLLHADDANKTSTAQLVTTATANGAGGIKEKKKKRRLSSPNFFKSAFSKNSNKLKNNLSSSVKSAKNTPHDPTSWEWYRLKKSEANKLLQAKNSNNATASLDSSSLSEINFPTSSTENSFRILEEAILSSGETLSGHNSNTSNGHANNTNGISSLGSGSSSGSQRSSTSSNAPKKKSRSFNRILRKVF